MRFGGGGGGRSPSAGGPGRSNAPDGPKAEPFPRPAMGGGDGFWGANGLCAGATFVKGAGGLGGALLEAMVGDGSGFWGAKGLCAGATSAKGTGGLGGAVLSAGKLGADTAGANP